MGTTPQPTTGPRRLAIHRRRCQDQAQTPLSRTITRQINRDSPLGVNLHGTDDPTEAGEQTWQACADTRHHATGRGIALFRESLEKVQAVELERLPHRPPKLNERSRLEIRQFA